MLFMLERFKRLSETRKEESGSSKEGIRSEPQGRFINKGGYV